MDVNIFTWCVLMHLDVPVWSKLESGRIPSPQEMFQIIENHMQLSQRHNSAFNS